MIDVHAIGDVPVIAGPHRSAGDDDAPAPAERRREINAPEDLLREDTRLHVSRLEELGREVRHERVEAVEPAEDEDVTRQQRDGRAVRTRDGELSRGLPRQALARVDDGMRDRDESGEERERADHGNEPAEPRDHRAWSVTLPAPTPCCENQVLPSSTRSKRTVYVPGVDGTRICAFTLTV